MPQTPLHAMRETDSLSFVTGDCSTRAAV